MIKYMVLFPHTFSTQFNFVELDYLSVSYKKMIRSMKYFQPNLLSFSRERTIRFIALHYVFYVTNYFGGNHRKILLTRHNTIVDYYFYHQFDIIKSDKYEVNRELSFKKIPNEVKQRISAKYLWE